MPAYDFRCEPCDTVFEIVRPASQRTDVCCPECGQAAKRVFSPVGVVFKGSGFHSTDYRKSAEPAAASKDVEKCSSDAPACDGCPAKKDD